MRRVRLLTAVAVGSFAMIGVAGSTPAADLHVLASTALKPLFQKVGPEFEAMSGERLVFSWGASYGNAPDALPVRLRNGEKADLVVMIREALDEQVKQGNVRTETLQDLATSHLGLAVQVGAPRPDIATTEGLRRTLLAAKSVAVSSGVSGDYAVNVLFPKMGIVEQLREKTVMIAAPALVGDALRNGKAQVGLQQMSELLAVSGVQIIGPLPDEVQRVNVIAAAVAAHAQRGEGAVALIRHLQSPQAAQSMEEFGFSPIGSQVVSDGSPATFQRL
ncbi:substrate-binding domain-containing protein [Pseudomonas sp. REP124]|uniref:molybdate ABC transporter substrate-binding protein n=1 Tax=Pseudomonas sp. REP124 TaxID=2875731 RepID=UPI001CC8FB7E|nr:substrate-binding domain-containing protein [Pseudomonas sp. REP124]MBZ9780020.1 substrate-binding domain-containing protein [Pseudomonas sp. REP124]